MQSNRAMLTRLREEPSMMACTRPASTFHGRSLLKNGRRMMVTSPETSAKVGGLIAELFRVIAKDPPMRKALLWTSRGAAGLPQDCTR